MASSYLDAVGQMYESAGKVAGSASEMYSRVMNTGFVGMQSMSNEQLDQVAEELKKEGLTDNLAEKLNEIAGSDKELNIGRKLQLNGLSKSYAGEKLLLAKIDAGKIQNSMKESNKQLVTGIADIARGKPIQGAKNFIKGYGKTIRDSAKTLGNQIKQMGIRVGAPAIEGSLRLKAGIKKIFGHNKTQETQQGKSISTEEYMQAVNKNLEKNPITFESPNHIKMGDKEIPHTQQGERAAGTLMAHLKHAGITPDENGQITEITAEQAEKLKEGMESSGIEIKMTEDGKLTHSVNMSNYDDKIAGSIHKDAKDMAAGLHQINEKAKTDIEKTEPSKEKTDSSKEQKVDDSKNPGNSVKQKTLKTDKVTKSTISAKKTSLGNRKVSRGMQLKSTSSMSLGKADSISQLTKEAGNLAKEAAGKLTGQQKNSPTKSQRDEGR